jgi:hypothetical protein
VSNQGDYEIIGDSEFLNNFISSGDVDVITTGNMGHGMVEISSFN